LGEYHYFGIIKIYGMDLHLIGSRMQDDYLVKHRAKSIFLHGLEYLKSILSNVEHKMDEFLEMVELFGMYLNRIYFEHRKTII